MTSPEPYSAYVRSFAKAASGAKISEQDFDDGPLPERLDLPSQIAVALAVQDVSAGEPKLRTRGEFDVELKRLAGEVGVA